ncbi:MAG: phosphatase PAP2 family protein [Polaromonas sp.]|nr:phosphatase PAP2 family protein [Polaromonas sp.]
MNSLNIWHLLTRLGEAQLLLPAAALTAIALFVRAETRRLAWSWMLLIMAAARITTASKIAFIGWGIGSAAIDFTGISGHAMFAAAIYPIVMVTFVPGQFRGKQPLVLALGCALAIVVGVSRIKVGAHSWSEVLAGLFLGGSVTAAALAGATSAVVSVRPIVPALLLAWVAVVPFQLPASTTHLMVTRLAVAMSGNERPYKRSDLLRPARDKSPLRAAKTPRLLLY